MVKLVFIDLDDTFLNSEKKITPENRRILDVAYERGVQFVPCSGRNVSGLPAEIVQHPSVKYVICCNGGVIAEADTGKVLHEVPIEKRVVRDLYHHVRDLRVTFDIFSIGKVFTPADRFEIIDQIGMPPAHLAFVKGERVPYDGTIEDFIDSVGPVDKVSTFYLTDEDRSAVWAAVDALPELSRTFSLSNVVEINNVKASKGTALTWLCDYLGVPIKDSVAFGDSDNDIPMIRAAGDGVAMANACQSVIDAADHTTVSCNESGVARYLEAILGA